MAASPRLLNQELPDCQEGNDEAVVPFSPGKPPAIVVIATRSTGCAIHASCPDGATPGHNAATRSQGKAHQHDPRAALPAPSPPSAHGQATGTRTSKDQRCRQSAPYVTAAHIFAAPDLSPGGSFRSPSRCARRRRARLRSENPADGHAWEPPPPSSIVARSWFLPDAR